MPKIFITSCYSLELVQNVSETPTRSDTHKESDMCQPGPSKEGAFGRVLSFKDYYEHKTKTAQGRQLSSKKQKNN